MQWRVGIIGSQRWAVEGVAQALHRAGTPAFEAIALAAEQLADPPVDVLVAVEEGNERAALIARTVPQQLPILWLGAKADTPQRLGPVGRLDAEADADVLAAAVHALACGLHVSDAAHRDDPPLQAVAGELSEPLTPRELEVLELMAKGLANREIALALGISSHTAKFHVARILEKAGAATRTEAVRQALRLGLIGL